MANSYFYYYPGTYPDGATPLRALDLGRRAALIDESPAPVEFSVGNLSGAETVQTWAVDLPVTITAEGIPIGLVQRQLSALVSHARRGGVFGFSLDHAKTWAATRTGGLSVAAGSTLGSVVLTGPYWRAWQTSPTLGSGDLVAVESLDGARRMVHAVSAVGAYSTAHAGITIDGFTEFSLTDFIVRYRYTYPALRLTNAARRAPLLSTTNGHTWALSLECVVARDVLARPTASILAPLPGITGVPATTPTAYGPR